MKKLLIVLVAFIGFGIFANANKPYNAKYCNEDGIELQLLSGSKWQMYIPGEGTYNGEFTAENGKITLKDGKKDFYGSYFWNSAVNSYQIEFTGLIALTTKKCK